MYQFQPMANDYYPRQNQMYGQQMNFPPQFQTPQVNSRFVTSIDEAKAAMIDPLSYNLFLDSGNGKIYLKKLANNGQAEFLAYSAEERTEEKKQNPIEEINERLSNIEKFLGGLKNDKSISNDTKSNADVATTIQQSDVGVTEEQSAGFPKNAGNDKWKKR